MRKKPHLGFKKCSLSVLIFVLLPGCYLNTFVNWKWVCRTNTLGWEQCDLMRVESNGHGSGPFNVHTRIVATSSDAQTEQEMASEVAEAERGIAQAQKNAAKVENKIKAEMESVQSEIDALAQSLSGF